VSNDSKPSAQDSQSGASAVGQTANIGRSTSVSSGAAKVFREFKWGLLTLFLLMVVVIGLVYDGGRKKKQPESTAATPVADDRGLLIALDGEVGAPPVSVGVPPVAGNVPPPPHIPAAPVADNVAPPVVPTPVAPEPRPAPVSDPIAAAPVPPAPPKPEAGNEKTYIVKGGDTLTSIASAQLPGKGGLKAILDANKDVLPNPNKLRVGMTLKIPAALAAVPDAPKTDVSKKGTVENKTIAAPTGGASEYVVQSGDTLERIARKLFNDGRKWKEIYEWNRDQLPDASRLRVGQVLKIKQGVSTVEAPAEQPSSSRAEIIEPLHSNAEKRAALVKIDEPAKESESAPKIEVMSANSSASFP